ncbi:MAG: 3-isopropylmalate dehydrogenase [Candidatus Binatia bacterium]|nr:MAG: 3-isopropylmalate dehydrogenase [Candidatus Binatia bacterium]
MKILVLPGDGIGPEVTAEAVGVLRACAERFGLALELEEGVVGGSAIDLHGTPLPADVLRAALEADGVLLGAVGGPKWEDPNASVRPEQALLALRKELGLFANLRPVRVHPRLVSASPLRPDVVSGADFVFVRELTGGIYFGAPSEERGGPRGREAVDTCFYTEAEIARVARCAFGLARSRRKKVTSVDKANILATSRLWRKVVGEVGREFPDVTLEHVLVDAMAMHLLRRPRDFDVVVTENLFGDILTDEASMVAGSMGLLPSASLGEARNRLGRPRGLYEPIHGSAPDIAGRDLANPLAAILSAALLLRYSCGAEEAAATVERVVDEVVASGVGTPDLARDGAEVVGCKEMGRLVREKIREGG